MILLIIHMRVSPEKRKELSQTITSLLSNIRAEKGCTRCDLFSGVEDASLLCLVEEWDSQKNLERHRSSACFKVIRGAMKLLATSCEILSYRIEPITEEIDLSLMIRHQ